MEWRTFDLHPEYPPEGIPREELLRRYGSGFADSVRAMMEEAELPTAERLELVPNARKSLVLAELARDEGRLDAYLEKTFAAYWAQGRNIGDDEVLLDLARESGVDEHEARAELVEQQRLDRVLQSTVEMTELGGTGVPAWVIDQKVLVPGAQPHEVFARILEKLGHARDDGNEQGA